MPDPQVLTLVLAWIGALVVFCFLLEPFLSLLQVCRSLLAPWFLPHEETSLPKKFGSWALITGSTDGIGKAYALELAKRGMNIVLVSRNINKLRDAQREIESKYSVKTKAIQVDFSVDKDATQIVKKELQDLPIGILVNNVGKQYEYPMYLGEVPEKELWDIINVNVGAVTLMCRAFIEDMKQRGRGAIVNVSSGSEIQPLPLMTVYAATKTYVRNFTLALRSEYAPHGITIQHLAPMFVATKMNHFSEKINRKSLFVPDAESYARYAVATLGKMDNSTGYWTHGLQTFLCEIPPEWFRIYVGGHMNKIFRNDYLKSSHRIKSR
ncbi:hydroxysteroid dehydrogenase-like protein 1 [Cylas formicarius]|uniref:hydroxysteroid dehydrogenase-like protein 1 n=1 Tax=Cylas formicarius TaxID=197179 RepID=UPI0029587084|nr:hydroxysteroid dehydrogenase-like protein 1 [Cylas formicarius]